MKVKEVAYKSIVAAKSPFLEKKKKKRKKKEGRERKGVKRTSYQRKKASNFWSIYTLQKRRIKSKPRGGRRP